MENYFKLFLLLGTISCRVRALNKPNIIFILADDLGWDDVSFHGSRQIPTPNLDALAYDGILLANYYVQPICTPTRGALLTGRHPIHTGLQHSVILGSEPYGLPLNETVLPQYLNKLGYKSHMVGKMKKDLNITIKLQVAMLKQKGSRSDQGLQQGVIVGSERYGLPLNETVLPQYLNKLGYQSHIVGKWHLGFFADEYTPTWRGFHSHYGLLLGKEDYWDHTSYDGHAEKNEIWHLGFFAEEYTPTRRGFHSHYGYFMRKEDYWDHTNGEQRESWHLGMFANEYTPTYRGFLSHYGYYQGMEDYWDHSYEATNEKTWGLDFHRNNEIVKTDYGKYSTELFTNEAESIISEHNTSEPLFLYLPFQAVHSANAWQPLEAPYEYYEKFSHIQNKKRRMFAAMVSCLDSAVGNITKALHNKGMLENSVIVFSTDNGGPPNGFDYNCASNDPLRGTKAGLWEGGVHGDGFIWTPLLKTSGFTSHAMIQVIDWLPTLLSVAGYDMTSLPRNLDGIDQWSTLSEGNQKGVRTEMLHNTDWDNKEYALRMNDLKLIYAKDGTTNSWQDWYKQEQARTEMLHNIDDTEGSWALRIEEFKLISAQRGYTMDWQDWYHMETVATGEMVGNMFNNLNSQSGVSSIQQQRSAAEYGDSNEIAPAHLFKTELTGILQSMGRQAKQGTPFVINCGPKPADAAINCNVSAKPCLYNVTADPCEYHNLADKMPAVVEKMTERLMQYSKTAVPPGNKPQDPEGFPINHGGLWVPWVTLEDEDLPEGYVRPQI